MGHRLDEIDRRILYRLAQDARDTSAPTIAREVDVSAGTIRNRIHQLEEAGIIRGYHAHIDYERSDGRITNLFMCNTDVPEREKLAQRALGIPGVVNVRELMAGRGNLHVVAVGTDTNDMTRVARELSNLGIQIEDEALVQDERFHPYSPFGPEDGGKLSMTDSLSLAGDAEVVELTVGGDAAIAGLTLEEADTDGLLDDDDLVIAIERGDAVLTPRGNTRVETGDLVTVFSRDGVSAATVETFRGKD